MRYTGLELWGLSLRIMRIRYLFLIQPLLLQLWSYERLAVGRPLVSHEPYHGGMYGDEEDEIGRASCRERVSIDV